MWACLQDHDTANHWKQVAGWRKVCDLAQTHLGRLQQYRRGLAEAWPPETSAASRTYLAELDELIDKVQRTHDAAAANYTALSAATQAIGTTRAALGKIYEEYATKFQQKQAYESMVADPKAVMGNRATAPPVADGELERLNVQARSMMFNLSSELQQAQATLQKPPPPPRRPGHQPNDPDVYETTAPSPLIPPVVAVPIAPAAPPSRTPTAVPAGPTPTLTPPSLGPVLGGAGTALTPSTPNQIPAGLANPSPASPGASISPPTGISMRPIGGLAPQAPPGSIGRPQAGTESPTHRSTPPVSNRAMPPGGIIGGPPTIGLGQPGSGTNSPRRVNPIGGVIGGGGAGTAPSGGAGSRPSAGRGLSAAQNVPPIGGGPGLTSPAYMQPNPARPIARTQADSSSPHWDPDNPWETEKGVTPVVRPPDDEGPIDPGPAIGFAR
ncbi:hypothetical protein IW248_004232 [Micromonospora ureilytica]|uniref:PPE family domain-containing protein n=1 Tax=Micromonospora ureilytica TaxID=709868 RepID=A0ABS0JLN0_9ACTN|nr:hypothetical protein [Micromonospora ureilytica]